MADGFFDYDFSRLPHHRGFLQHAVSLRMSTTTVISTSLSATVVPAADSGPTAPPVLYLNDGSGFFTDATAELTPNAVIRDQQDCHFFDADGDLDLDRPLWKSKHDQRW